MVTNNDGILEQSASIIHQHDGSHHTGQNQDPNTITIDIPTSSQVHNIQVHNVDTLHNAHHTSVNVTEASSVLSTDYMNILDVVLDKESLQETQNMSSAPTIVLADMNTVSDGMVAVSDGTTISLTPEQIKALTEAAARGETSISILNADEESHPASGSIEASPTIIPEEPPVKEVHDDETVQNTNQEIEFETDPCQGSSKDPVMKQDKNIQFRCEDCDKQYVSKASLKKHLQLIHNKELDVSLQKATNKCIHPGCDHIFYHRQKMIDHLKEAHDVNCVQEDLVFSTWEEFLMWKEKEEDANFVHFSKNSTHTNAKNYMLTNFTCQREGKAGYKYKGSQQKKYKDLVIGEKICPARMRARLDKPTGRVTVQYCKSHNHKLSFQDFLYRRMPDRLRTEIRQKLASGMSSEEVYKNLKSADNLRENRGERFAPSKRQFVTLVNIKTIAKRMNIKEPGISKHFFLEPEPLTIQIQKLLDETHQPVLLFKEQGSKTEVGPEEIDNVAGSQDLSLIAFQTKEQQDMFVKHGSKVVFIDITEAIITPNQYVISLKVLDEYNKGYPVAFLISNSRDETVLFYFFREVQNRVLNESVQVNAVMTENSCNEYYAFRSVFGEDVKHLLCKWNLHRAWCQKIHEECAGDEALQQELYFIFVTMLEEMDLTKFESIATEFVNNYQPRCPSFITFFMTNYLSQPEVWASCYRNHPLADCDEILYADRLHERIKKEIKNNRRVKSLDDMLDMLLRFEHEDYFNRGLNLMLNPPEPHLIQSEHVLGMKINNEAVIENHSAENKWLVKTSKRDPADLQNIKEETFIVTWQADVCEKDFCRERCLKLSCFGLCGHLYECSCDGDPVTPCRHIHKIHSMRIGVSQFQNTGDSEQKDFLMPGKQTPLVNSSVNTANSENVVKSTVTEVSKKKDSAPKLNLVNPNDALMREAEEEKNKKIKEIKIDLVQLYRFLESDNVQKYSLDFIETGLKKVIEECDVIDSIGQEGGSTSAAKGKRKRSADNLRDEFENLVKSVKRKRIMGTSVPVIVEIEPNPSIYNTFRKRITGSQEETPEDRMLKLEKSKQININIVSDEKYRRTQSQKITQTPGIIVAKEGDDTLVVEGEELPAEYYEHDEKDEDWTPKSKYVYRGTKGKRGRGRPRKKPLESSSTIQLIEQVKVDEDTIPALDTVEDPTMTIINNGPHPISMADIKALDTNATEPEQLRLKEIIPSYSFGYLTDAVINSYIYNLTKRVQVLYLTMEQMQGLASNAPYTARYWNIDDVSGPTKKNFVIGPMRLDNRLVAFVIDLVNETIMYLDPANRTDENNQTVKDLQSTLVGLMVVERPFVGSNQTTPTWTLSSVEKVLENEESSFSVRCLWYINRICHNMDLSDDSSDMASFRNSIYLDVAGHSIGNVGEKSS